MLDEESGHSHLGKIRPGALEEQCILPTSGAVVGSPGTFLPVRPRPRSPSEFRVVQRCRKAQGALGMAVKLFVGGLSFSTSNERLREAFAACGAVESASVVTDRDTGRSRGFG